LDFASWSELEHVAVSVFDAECWLMSLHSLTTFSSGEAVIGNYDIWSFAKSTRPALNRHISTTQIPSSVIPDFGF